MDLDILGLIFNFAGSFILILVSFFGVWHQRNEIEKWTKRYWWMGWRPIYKNTQTLKWKTKWNSFVVRHGAIPPKHQWNVIGFSYISIGFLLQLINYL